MDGWMDAEKQGFWFWVYILRDFRLQTSDPTLQTSHVFLLRKCMHLHSDLPPPPPPFVAGHMYYFRANHHGQARLLSTFRDRIQHVSRSAMISNYKDMYMSLQTPISNQRLYPRPHHHHHIDPRPPKPPQATVYSAIVQ